MAYTGYSLLVLAYCLSGALAAPGDFGSGDFSGEESCFDCLSEIRSSLTAENEDRCAEVGRLTECFSSCSPNAPSGSADPDNTRALERLALLGQIFEAFRHFDCPVTEDLAPGCDADVTACLRTSVFDGPSRFDDLGVGALVCSDESYGSYLECSESSRDCEWRNHLDALVSSGRRNGCMMADRCHSGETMFLVSPGCSSLRLTSINRLSQLTTQTAQSMPAGTLFDTTLCLLQHASSAVCKV